ncbi:MAG: copper resistance protein CopC [Vicinamibacterales bacterium]|nr:copper resistance protein CopC [Vicinamibacterales bacterium]HJO16903.1 copper resistance protein CopC [Vicinamibacterales bacterium]
MKRKTRWILGVGITVFLFGPTLAAHLAVTKTEPEANTTVESPSLVQIWFTQKPELVVSTLNLKQGDLDVSISDVEAGRDNSLVARVDDVLPSGNYIVEWKTAGDDGHVLRGEFSFSVSNVVAQR